MKSALVLLLAVGARAAYTGYHPKLQRSASFGASPARDTLHLESLKGGGPLPERQVKPAATIELRFEGSPKSFTKELQSAFLAKLAAFGGVDPSCLMVVEVSAGSVRIVVALVPRTRAGTTRRSPRGARGAGRGPNAAAGYRGRGLLPLPLLLVVRRRGRRAAAGAGVHAPDLPGAGGARHAGGRAGAGRGGPRGAGVRGEEEVGDRAATAWRPNH